MPSSSSHQTHDSIDLQDARGRGQGFNWLAAVNPNSPNSTKKTATPTPSPPTVTQTTPMRTANSATSWCFSPESLTAMGSPIPIETDDTDALSGQPPVTAYPGREGGGNSPIPHLTPPQPFDAVSHTTVVHQSGHGGTPFYVSQTLNASSPDGLPSPVAAADATSPFAPSAHNSYSSAIMQALSMSEGVAIAEAAQNGSLAPVLSSPTSPRTSDALYQEGMRAKLAKQQWATVEKARQELLNAAKARRECSFTPTLSPYAAQVQRPAALRPENRAQAEVLRKKQWLALKKQESIARELEECTFHPLTLRSVHLEPPALQANSAVFDELYEDAQEKQFFADNVRAQVVEDMEKNVLYPRTNTAAMPPQKITEVVDRLFAKSTIVGTTPNPADTKGFGETATHQPELAPRTLQIMEAKEEAGERNPNVVDRLYSAQRGPTAETLIQKQLEEQRERTMRLVHKQELEQERQILAMEHNRALLCAKFRALSKRAASARGVVYKPDRPQSVVGLARASLDVLTSEEAEELLYILEKCTTECIGEAEFVERIIKAVNEAPATSRHALLRCPPPASSQVEAMRRARLTAPAAAGASTALTIDALPKVERQSADPAALQRAKERREQRMEEYRQEKERRAAMDPFNGDAHLEEDCTFQPAPRRLIPYECRPDVQIDVKPTRAFELRRARALGLPLPSRARSTEALATDVDERDVPSSAPAHTRSHGDSEESQDTARLLRFADDEAAVSESAEASTGVATRQLQAQRREHSRTTKRPLALKKPQPATYADLAEARERLSVHDVSGATSTASALARPKEVQPVSDAVVPRHTDPAPRASSIGKQRTVSPHSAPMPSIAEMAATGGEQALRQLGRDLLLRQLREFQNGRRQNTVR